MLVSFSTVTSNNTAHINTSLTQNIDIRKVQISIPTKICIQHTKLVSIDKMFAEQKSYNNNQMFHK